MDAQQPIFARLFVGGVLTPCVDSKYAWGAHTKTAPLRTKEDGPRPCCSGRRGDMREGGYTVG